MNKTLFQISFAVSILILIGVGYSAYHSFKDFENDNLWVAHGERVKAKIENLSSIPQAVSNEIRRSILLRDTLDYEELLELDKSIDTSIQLLDSLVLDNAEQSANIHLLENQINVYLDKVDDLADQTEDVYNMDHEMRRYILEQDEIVNGIMEIADHMVAVENKLLEERLHDRQKSSTLAPFILLLLTIFALSIISFLFINTFSLLKQNEITANNLSINVNELNQEVAERKALEMLLTGILNSSAHGILAFKAMRNEENKIIDFKFTNVNNKACEMVNFTREELLNGTMLDLIPGNKASGLFDAYTNVVKTGETFHTTQFYAYDALDTWFEITAVKNGDGFVVTFADVSDQKQREEALIKNQEELKATNFELEQFAYIASHDLQEPLRKVRTFGDHLNSLYEEKLDEKGTDYIHRMQNAAERMQILIDDILKFSRISRSEREFKKVDLNEVFSNATDMLEIKIKEKNALITKQNLPFIKGDFSELSQLFVNLLGNALKYAKTDVSPIIEITASDKVNDIEIKKKIGNYWKININDNGIGFDPKYKKQIFVIFQRLHGRTEYQGTGIGLAICEKIVTNHGGIIHADSSPNNGASFSIYFPKQY